MAVPGPLRRGRLPDPMPAGVLPPEDSRLWLFIPKAITAGEKWIQDDTREWFDDNDRKVQVCRAYPTHPRWVIGKAADTLRGSLYNEGITSEVHLLVRITAELPEVPAWVPAQLGAKQLMADTGYRLTKLARGALIQHGATAMKDFAERNPGQFLKFIGSTFVPKQIEIDKTITPGQSLDPEQADSVLQSLAAELKRREDEARLVKMHPHDYEAPGNVIDGLQTVAKVLNTATGVRRPQEVHDARKLTPVAAQRLRHVIDPDAVDINPETGEIEWD